MRWRVVRIVRERREWGTFRIVQMTTTTYKVYWRRGGRARLLTDADGRPE